MSLSGILIHLFKAHKATYLKNLNMFSLRQIHSKVNSTYIMMAILSILLLIAIGTFSTGMGIVSVVDENQEALLPVNLSLNYWFQTDGLTIENDIPEIQTIGDYQKITFYRKEYRFSDILEESLDKGVLEQYGIENHAIEFIRLSEFNAFLKSQDKKTYDLDGEYILLSNHYEIFNILKRYSKEFHINKQTLQKKLVLEISVQNSPASNISAVIVLEDSLLEDMTPVYEVYNFNEIAMSTESTVNFLEKIRQEHFYFEYVLKDRVIAESLGLKTIISYISIYIGFVFIMSVVVCLALQQLGEASDNVHRYELLRKLGVEDKMIKHSLLTQIGVYFFMPLGLAVIHSIVGIKVASGLVQVVGNLNILQNMLLTSGFLILIYGSYFIVTYVASVAIVIKQR
jgi:putative ABC transport system permease protein